MSKQEWLDEKLVGKKIVRVEIDPTQAGFGSYHRGSVFLILDNGEEIHFKVGGGMTSRYVVVETKDGRVSM